MQDPLIEIHLESDREQFAPSDFLSGEFWVRLKREHEIQALEYSVIWITEGKGEEDIGVHYFQRRNRTALVSDALSQPQRFSTVLPASPLTYEGMILKIRWCVRVRIFLSGGREVTKDREFDLGHCSIPEIDLKEQDDLPRNSE
ncbi:MAG: hypothetical protein AAFN77_18910 [Planctomycetota bacterium]